MAGRALVIIQDGVLGRDYETRFTQDGKQVLTLNVATSAGRDKTIWWKCTAWEKTAERLEKLGKTGALNKGKGVSITGYPQEGRVYEDRNSGEVKYAGHEMTIWDLSVPPKGQSDDDSDDRDNDRSSRRSSSSSSGGRRQQSSDSNGRGSGRNQVEYGDGDEDDDDY